MYRNITISLLIILVLQITGCETISLYERVTSIPGHKWASSYKPEFRFNITDTVSPYEIYITLRHNEKYAFNNIWLKLSTRFPGDTAIRSASYELPLANNEGWIGKEKAMDDLYDHWILITPRNQPLNFPRSGEYIFTLEHIMRQDPLENVLNVGLRIEKRPAQNP
jgi:gliding motility-associated lipoprotein GldH